MKHEFKVTTNGNAAIIACMALSKPPTITRVEFGQGLVPEGTDLADIHCLVNGVADGTLLDVRHAGNTLSFTIQYANISHPDTADFPLTEYMVYIQDPETGEATDYIYGTLGDYRQPMPQYRDGSAACVFSYPLEVILSGALEVHVDAPAGLVTWADLGQPGGVATLDDSGRVPGKQLPPVRLGDIQGGAEVKDAPGEEDLFPVLDGADGTMKKTTLQALASAAAEANGGSIGGGGSGNELNITFEAAFQGQQYTVTDGTETKTGTVPEGLSVSVWVAHCNSVYTVTAAADNGVEYSTTISTGPYYGQYMASLTVFTATVNVTAAPGAEVKATLGRSVFTAAAGEDGTAAVKVNQAGTYTVSASKDGASSNTASVEVTEEGASYTAAVQFIVLTVTSEAGSELTVTDGTNTYTRTSAGTDVFYLPGMGTWTASITDGTETAEKSVEVTAYQDYALKVMYVSEILAENDWEKIREVADAGEAKNYWAVGDSKPVTLNGTIGTLKVTNLTLDAFILGFDHNASLEGSNRIDFLIGKKDGKLVGLCDSNYGSSSTNGAKWYNMNHWGDYNYGGWAGCDLRYDILGSTNKAPSGYGSAKTTSCAGYDAPEDSNINPVANTVMAALPLELRQQLRLITKYADNTGNSSNVADHVKATKDYLFLLAEFEMQGARTYANTYEQNKQQQYEYFKAGNSKIAYNHSSPSSAVVQWLRSALYSYSNAFCVTHGDGAANRHAAYSSWAVLPGFSI